jgi:hypothetical protein
MYDGYKEVFLVLKVEVDRTLTNAGFLGDFLKVRFVKATTAKHPHGSIENFLGPFLRAALPARLVSLNDRCDHGGLI